MLSRRSGKKGEDKNYRYHTLGKRKIIEVFLEAIRYKD